jgi:ubiquinol-cytochrome c reductase cytochrome c subunit
VALVLAALTAASPAAADRGRDLFVEGCSTCHGLDAGGMRGIAPSLHGVGARAADFYLSTGRMPLNDPREQPLRNRPAYARGDIDAIVRYIGSLGGPPVPNPDPERGSVRDGMEAFTTFCAGCHSIVGAGGIVTGGVAPPLDEATPRQIAEAVRIGPYLMPSFGDGTIDDRTLDSIIRYVEYTKDPEDPGGWPLGRLGPVPEGLVAWLLAGAVLVGVVRLLGERAK